MSKKWKVALGILVAVIIVAGITTSVVRQVAMRNQFQTMMESGELPETQGHGRFLPWDGMRMRPGMFPGMHPRIGGVAVLFLILPVLAVGTFVGLAIGLGITLVLRRRWRNQPEEIA